MEQSYWDLWKPAFFRTDQNKFYISSPKFESFF